MHANFYYDLIKWIKSEYDFSRHKSYFLKNYLSGEYDLNIIKSFSLFNCEFNKRAEYIYIFILEDIYISTLKWARNIKEGLNVIYNSFIIGLEELNKSIITLYSEEPYVKDKKSC